MNFRFLLISSVSALVAMPAVAQDAGDAARGRNYAERVCAECHGIELGEERSPNFAAPSFAQVANTPGMTATALAVWLQNPHPSMPNFVIPIDDMHDVIAYILTLKNKP